METIGDITNTDLETIVDALENYKHKGFAGELMTTLVEGLLAKKKDEMTEEELLEYNARQVKKELEREEKQRKEEQFKRDVDLLKAKIVIILETKKRREQKGLSN